MCAIVKIDILSIGKIKMNAKMKWRVAFETFYLYLLFINKKKVIY
jgi:hypothetical protein